MLEIPQSILSAVKKESDVMDNRYLTHAIMALKSLDFVNEDNYCPDYISVAANTLERIYKGFLEAATIHCEDYQLPQPNFLTCDHDIYGMMMEIKRTFSDVFPYQSREDWQNTKKFLRSLRSEYTNARYSSYPTYEEFCSVRTYVKQQYQIVETYLKEGYLNKKEKEDYSLDY